MIISYNLQKLDNDDSHNGSFWVVKKVCKSQELKTPLYEQSLNGLQEDEFGDIQYQSKSLHYITTLHYIYITQYIQCKDVAMITN